MVQVSYPAVLVAAILVFVLGWLWYSPLLFYKPWMRLRGMDPVAAMAGANLPAGKLVRHRLQVVNDQTDRIAP
ncbi:MAG: hypothetical protein DMD37_07615 [Gemmatimonadetes bacterium]|nr:MAG: hypothetical protein DMD68_09810 [Gemmatimonadota bacterium]PYP63035.1 MAG: hypothetical protein DMD37_07615 [Gemmatimonadota bacterium]